MSDDKASRVPEQTSRNGGTRTEPQPQHQQQSGPDMKRSAVKELIERYFFQLQRGCGNTQCTNANCASSGRVPLMTPNEMAAKAIQLFSQDAHLCYVTQPPKVARTNQDSPTSSRSTATADISLGQQDAEMLSVQDNISTSSSSSNSTITSGSSSSSNSSCTSSTGASLGACSIRTNISGGANEDVPLLESYPPDPEELSKLYKEYPLPRHIKTESGAVAACSTPHFLTERLIDELIEDYYRTNSFDRLLYAIEMVFKSVERLSISFCRTPLAADAGTAQKITELLEKASDLKKEDLRMLLGENDKDEDSTCVQSAPAMATEPTTEGVDIQLRRSSGGCDTNAFRKTGFTLVDFESMRRVRDKLLALNNATIQESINENIILLAESVTTRRWVNWEKVIHCLAICFDLITKTLGDSIRQADVDQSLPKLCHAARSLPIRMQARLARIWAIHNKADLPYLVQYCQQLITIQVMADEDNIQENQEIVALTKVLRIAYYSNILAGKEEYAQANEILPQPPAVPEATDPDDMFAYAQVTKPFHTKIAEDKLEKALGISVMDCRKPLIPFEDFYNEVLSDIIPMDRDYLCYKNLSLDPAGEDLHFSFMLYAFILTPASKVVALYYDSRIRMYSERSSSLFSMVNYVGSANSEENRPDLKLKVHRDNLINDALVGLELTAMSNPKDLKKQLVVEFIGEQGIDEGGVSKEFFQLIVEEIFNPDFGMFVQQEETNTVWFNTTSFENEAQFTLVGIIIGLAIYNNIILAVNFPMVVYRKLMGCLGNFYDLHDWNPTIYRSLNAMLEYAEPDFVDVFMQTFKISWTNVFGEVEEHELKPGGGDISVDQTNKLEFVKLYSDFLLNKSIARQFQAFKRGFEMVTDESPLKLLFRPEEIELLVCGSKKFDFVELERSTDYEGGYTSKTQIITDFWSIVHSLPEESKRKLLEFTTGSDRVPVGGLSRLKFLITRHGPDSDRLPTAHTCFNILLLPEYSSREKLEERLLKAINYSKGFGML